MNQGLSTREYVICDRRCWQDPCRVVADRTYTPVVLISRTGHAITCVRKWLRYVRVRRAMPRSPVGNDEGTMTADAERLEKAIAGFDAFNDEDPNTETFEGEEHPKELL